MFLQEYENIRLIGRGAFASVYKVRHSDLGYIRALKVCNNFIEDENDRAWQAFVSECKVLLQIGNGSHPNIVRIYQPRLLNNRAVVEMDCVEGEPLSDYIKERRFIPIDEFYRFSRQIIGAVAYCHVDVYKFLMNPVEDDLEIDPSDGRKYIVPPAKEKDLIEKYGVVHNDLHSGNIIRRDYDGQYILLDFGLAVQDKHCVKSSSRFDGAIEYCSPEKLERAEISTQSDVYALGILMYEMLAGRVPFPYSNRGESSLESARNRVYMQHLNEMPPSIYELRKEAFESTHPGQTYGRDYPEALEKLILRCLAKEPSKRFDNAKDLQTSFEKYIESVEQAKEKTTNQQRESQSEHNSMMDEIRLLREEVQTLRRASSFSNHNTTIPNNKDKNSLVESRKVNINWFLSNFNWLWAFVLCLTCIITGICIAWHNYGDSEVIGAATMCTSSACVILLWVYKWKNVLLDVSMIILWLASVITAIVFTSDPIEPFIIIMGGFGLIGLSIAVTSIVRK